MIRRPAWAGALSLAVVAVLGIATAVSAAPSDYDANGDQVIDRGEVLAAIGDYLSDAIGREEVLEIIMNFLTGGQVGPAPSASGPELAWLSLTHGEPAASVAITPAFGAAVASYTAGVTYEVSRVTAAASGTDGVTPTFVLKDGTSPQPDADAGAAGHQVDLRPGENVIRVRAAAGETARLYTITVTRARPTVEITAASTSAREGDAVEFTVTRDIAADDALAVSVVVGETGDLVPRAGEGTIAVEIAPNAYAVTHQVHTIADDTEWDPHSLVTATLGAGDSYMVGASGSAQTQVLDDDFPRANASLAVRPNPVGEGDPTTATVTVTTAEDQAPHGDGGSLVVSTRNSTATAPLDFTAERRVHIVRARDFIPVDVDEGRRYRATYTTEISTVSDTIGEVGEKFTVSISKAGADRITLDAPTEVPVLIGESTDASLSALHLSDVTLSPAFASGTEAYAATVVSGVSSTTVTAIPGDAGATVVLRVGGVEDADGTVQLIEGINTIEVEVTAEDGATAKTYAIAVTREMPPPTVMDLRLSVGAISLVGYWSDGTADVEGTLALTNLSGDPVADAQPVTVSCVGDLNVRQGHCRWTAEVLGQGLTRASANFRVRVPAGTTTLRFAYGGFGSPPESLERDVHVEQRIVGIEREVWNCYLDRTSDDSLPHSVLRSGFYGCSGWTSPTVVHKMRGAGPVVVWATGHDRYIRYLREGIAELSPILNLDFQWTDVQGSADLRAYVGIPRDRWQDYGLTGISPDLLSAAGFAHFDTYPSGEVVPDSIVVWYTEHAWSRVPVATFAKRAVVHELLHTLTGVLHTSDRAASIVGYSSSLPRLSPMDEALFRLNSHPLVTPGMTLDEVGDLVVHEDELLDETSLEKGALELVWRAAVRLVDSGAARFHLTGGWTGDCNLPIGTASEPAVLEIGNFSHFLHGGSIAARYREAGKTYWLFLSLEHLGWLYLEDRDGLLVPLTHDELAEAVNWFEWVNKLPRTLYTLIADWSEEDVAVSRRDGKVTLRVALDDSHPHMWRRENGLTVEFTLVIDAETYELDGYTWKYRWDRGNDYCSTYEEVAQSIELGVDFNVPTYAGGTDVPTALQQSRPYEIEPPRSP